MAPKKKPTGVRDAGGKFTKKRTPLPDDPSGALALESEDGPAPRGVEEEEDDDDEEEEEEEEEDGGGGGTAAADASAAAATEKEAAAPAGEEEDEDDGGAAAPAVGEKRKASSAPKKTRKKKVLALPEDGEGDEGLVLVPKGDAWRDPCQRCVDSATGGKSTGECFAVAGGDPLKCWKCTGHNHACLKTPVAVRPIVRAMVQARKVSKTSALSSTYTKAVKMALTFAAETEAEVLAAAGVVGAGGAPAASLGDAQRASLLASVAALDAAIKALP